MSAKPKMRQRKLRAVFAAMTNQPRRFPIGITLAGLAGAGIEIRSPCPARCPGAQEGGSDKCYATLVGIAEPHF